MKKKKGGQFTLEEEISIVEEKTDSLVRYAVWTSIFLYILSNLGS